jgi:hypothetical protein
LRKASAVALDEVDMLLLDKKWFDISIGVRIGLNYIEINGKGGQ